MQKDATGNEPGGNNMDRSHREQSRRGKKIAGNALQGTEPKVADLLRAQSREKRSKPEGYSFIRGLVLDPEESI